MTGRRDTSQAGLEPSVPPTGRDAGHAWRGSAGPWRFPGRAGRKARGGEEEGACFPGKEPPLARAIGNAASSVFKKEG